MNTFLGHTRAGTVLAWPFSTFFARFKCGRTCLALLACLKTRADLLKQIQNCAFGVKTNAKSTKDNPPLNYANGSFNHATGVWETLIHGTQEALNELPREII